MKLFSERNILSPSRRELAYGLGCWVAYQILYPFALLLALPALGVAMGTPYGGYLFNLLVHILSFVSVVLFFRRFLLASFRLLREQPRHFFSSLVIGLLLYFLSLFVLNYLTLVFQLTPTNLNQQNVTQTLLGHPLVFGLTTVLLVPVTEEVLVRGVIFAPLCKKSPLLAYVVSILIFGGLHILVGIEAGQTLGQLLITFLQYLPAGVFFGWVYQRTGSIWVSVFLHMLVNLISVVSIVFQ